MSTLIACSLFLFSILACSCSKAESKVAAVVNGEKIYKEEIEYVFKQYEGSVPRSEILYNAIDELLIIQEGRKMGVRIPPEEVNNRINELKTHYPELYRKVIHEYSLERYRKLLERRIIYERTKEQFFSKNSSKLQVSDEEALSYYMKKKGITLKRDNVVVDLTKEELDKFLKVKDEIKALIREQKKKRLLKNWLQELRRKSHIKIYN
jgi:hypothetical protein